MGKVPEFLTFMAADAMGAHMTQIHKSSSFTRFLFIAIAALLLFALPANADDLSAGIDLYQKKNFRAAALAFLPQVSGDKAATASYYLALCYIQLGSPSEAKVMFGRIVKQWPDSPEGKLAAAYMARSLAPDAKSGEAKAGAEGKNSADRRESESFYRTISKADWDKLPLKTRIPIQRENGHLWVTAKINGHYCKMVFDTGAAACFISAFDYPDVFTEEQLAAAKGGIAARTYGDVPIKILNAEISVQDITRTCAVGVIGERGCSVIGQNFFREYSYQVDDFYLRLTKAPYDGDNSTKVAVQKASMVEKTTLNVSSPSAQAHTGDKFSVPYEVVANCMYLNSEINGKPVRVCFDTGCAPDGIVINPRFAKDFDVRNDMLERFELGPMNLRSVRVHYASGIVEPLIGPKIFNRPYTVDPVNKMIKFDY